MAAESRSNSSRMAAGTRSNSIRAEIEKLRRNIQDLRKTKQNGGMEVVGAQGRGSGLAPNRIKMRRELNGHFGKVFAVDWSGDGKEVLSASQDGKLILWDAQTVNKIMSVPLRSSWVMTCSYEQTNAYGGRHAACGGLDNICSIYSLKEKEPEKSKRPVQTLVGHDGYIACNKFLDARTVLTASGDNTICKWDTESGKMVMSFRGHSADVLSISTNPKNVFVFISGSCDFSAKLWDIREKNGKCVQNFERCHDEDINAVSFFPSGEAFATGSDDCKARVFELRCRSEVAAMGGALASPIHSIGFSKSGRLLFAGYDDNKCRGWDVLKPSQPYCMLANHDNRVSCLSVNPSGDALVTGSWDSSVRIVSYPNPNPNPNRGSLVACSPIFPPFSSFFTHLTFPPKNDYANSGVKNNVKDD